MSVSISPPKGLDSSTYPVFSGFITISNGAESYHVTYLGIAASLRDKQVLDTTDEFFGVDLPALLDSQGNIQDGPVNYTFVGDDVPTLLTRYGLRLYSPRKKFLFFFLNLPYPLDVFIALSVYLRLHLYVLQIVSTISTNLDMYMYQVVLL